nr:unnamed protein product [Digitaria exilis]
MLFFSYFKELVGKEVTVELKNDLAIRGTLHSVDQYLNIKLENTRVVDQDKYPHMAHKATPRLLRHRGTEPHSRLLPFLLRSCIVWAWASTGRRKPMAGGGRGGQRRKGWVATEEEGLSVRNCFIRGSVVRYVLLPQDGVDIDILHDATRREARGG